ncbi:MAG: DUF2934 domain-containing protein [Burkholderiales bacterium]|nr:DUF2934 domain-containing protein [Burkholderiales bacterium]
MSVSKATPAAKKSIAATKAVVVKKPATKKAAAKPATKAASTQAASPKPRATKPAVGAKAGGDKMPAAKSTSAKNKTTKGNGATPITPEQRYRMICDAAYYRAERRGFIGGNPAEDWTAAEAEIDSLLLSIQH